MSVETAQERLAWLAAEADDGAVHTVRVSWADRLGAWRGKRVPVAVFLGSPERRLSFCDGMIVVDVNCDVHQSTPFSNFQTGYPDMYLRPRLETLAPVGWNPGEAFLFGVLESHGGTPLPVAPRNVLGTVLDRLADQGVEMQARVTLGGRLMHSPTQPTSLLADGRARGESSPGVLRSAAEGLIKSGVPVRTIESSRDGMFGLSLDQGDAGWAADAATIAKAALKEIARSSALTAVFMTRLRGAAEVSTMAVDVEVGRVDPDPVRFAAALSVLRPLLQPSINAFRAGRPSPPSWQGKSGESVHVRLHASSEADPATVLAATGAAIGAATNLEVEVPHAASAPGDLAAAAGALGESAWVRDWLGDDLIDNAVPLLLDEAAAFQSAVTDWEVDRYWRAG